MKLTRSAFESDVLTLTWRDLFILALGRQIVAAAMIVKRGNQQEPTQ